MKPRLLRIARVLLLSGPVCVAHADEGVSFAAWGDMPYSRFERDVADDILQAQATRPLAFSLHVGDIKSGSAPCDQALLQDRLALFARSRHPLILLAGDNDWLDCARAQAGAHDPFERLAALRSVLYAQAPALPGLHRSAASPEQARWQIGSVLFVTLNVPGSPLPDTAAGRGQARDALNWLDEALHAEVLRDVRALVVAFHAHPDFSAHAAGRGSQRYRALLDRLARFASADRRPLLIIHGDTHTWRVDRPLHDPDSGRRLDNVIRLETHGSPWLGWTEVDVQPDAPEVFRFRPYRATTE